MPRFAHESEKFFADLLDYYDVKWEYEKETFVITLDENGDVKKAFCPDFYLPEFDMYIEITVMKKATRKRKKIEDTKNKYPNIYIHLVDRDGLKELEEKHQFLLDPLTDE